MSFTAAIKYLFGSPAIGSLDAVGRDGDVRIFVLDDDEDRHRLFDKLIRRKFGHGYDAAYTVNEAIELLGRNRYTHVFLDHDLGIAGCRGTGYDVTNWIAAHKDLFKRAGTKFIIHSANPVGAARMLMALRDADLPTRREMFFYNIVHAIRR
jgi:hypothetical protein